MQIKLCPDTAALGATAADAAARTLNAAIAARGVARFIAATGASQFQFLAALTARGDIDWSKVEMFHLDEYVGIGPDHPASFRRYLLERLIRPAGITRAHLIDAEHDAQAACQALGARITAAPIDAAFVGIGENGHLAFNDPPADFETREPYLVVALDEACRRQQVGEGWFASLAEVPDTAVSMSCRQILAARTILVIVPDARKAEAVRGALEGPVTPLVPASILQTHPDVTVFLDSGGRVAPDEVPESRPMTRRPIRGLRWYIGGLLFLSTVINYIDRQTLSVLAPYLQVQYEWSNTDFAMVVIAFRLAYTIGQTGAGRLIDRLGTYRGLSLMVLWYSLAAMATALATGLRSFAAFRFLLGLGEAGNWPGATKAVSEWFPRRESGWAVALFDSGSSIGGALAPFIVIGTYHAFGDWRPAFVLTGALGFIWLLLFRVMYRRPEDHPRLSAEERAYILAGRDDAPVGDGPAQLPYATLLRLPQTWGYIVSKSFTDPVWFFITDWFAIYLVSKGFSIEASVLGFWVPFLAADLGNLFGGGVSSVLIARGWSVGAARKLIAVIGGLGMTLLVPTVWSSSYVVIVACFAASTFAYAAFSTIILNLPADIFPSGSVATVSGLGGTGAGIGTLAATYLTGRVADQYSFAPILLGASVIPLVAVAAVLLLVRNTAATDAGMLKRV